MPPRLLLPTVLIAATLLSSACRDREIHAYRAPKDPDVPMPAASPASMMNTNDLPEGHPPIGPDTNGGGMATMANTAVPTASGDDLAWSAPDAWTPKPGSPMRKGSYAVKTAAGEADLSITAFPGATGGLEANLNRWRGQVGLPTQPPDKVRAGAESFSSNGLEFTVADYAGSGSGAKRLLGAIVSYEGNSWFFKLMGPDAVVAESKPAFLKFLRTVKAPAK